MRYEYGDINYHYMPVDHPGIWTYPNDYKYPVACNEKEFGAKPIGIMCHAGDIVCVEHGTYLEPPVYDIDPAEYLMIRPVMKCWGRGFSLNNRPKGIDPTESPSDSGSRIGGSYE